MKQSIYNRLIFLLSLVVTNLLGVFSVFAASYNEGYFYPPDKKQELEALIKRLPLLDKDFSKQPQIEFTSAESFSADGKNIINRIAFQSGKVYDSWMMKQRVANSNHPESTLLLAIDKTASPPEAYYFQFNQNKLRPFTASCYHCHANGPRKIRPLFTRSTFSKVQLNLLEDWNKKITSYGKVSAYNLKFKSISPFLPFANRDPFEHEVLKAKMCYECHNSQSGIRQELKRLHRMSIEFLIREKQMPLHRIELSKIEKDCLLSWVALDPNEKIDSKCASNGEPKVSEQSKYIVDSVSSSMTIHVTTTFGSFYINQFSFSGILNCNQNVCSGQVNVDLSQVTTGIGLRDQHLKENIFATDKFSMAKLVFDELDLRPNANFHEIRMQFQNQSQKIKLNYHCEKWPTEIICQIKGDSFDVRDLGIAPPEYLGARVDPKVILSGQVVAKPGR